MAYPDSGFLGMNTSHTKPAAENISLISLIFACIYVSKVNTGVELNFCRQSVDN